MRSSNRGSIVWTFALTILVLSVAPPASAACPGIYSGRPCDGDSLNVESPVCTTTGTPSQVTCDLGLDGETSTTEAHFVSPSSTLFRAYGTAGDGETFCCELTVSTCPGSTGTLTVQGTVLQDEIALQDAAAGLSTDCMFAYVYGDDGNDTINGSNLTTNQDRLYGDDGDDAIHGRDGNDECHGGAGEDYIHGEDGSDTIYGDEDSDHLSGGNSGDTVYSDDGTGTAAGEGKGYILGGDGMDYLFGGQYSDSICGGADADTIYGRSGDDDIYGGVTAGDTIDGELGTDECEEGTCDYLTLAACTVYPF